MLQISESSLLFTEPLTESVPGRSLYSWSLPTELKIGLNHTCLRSVKVHGCLGFSLTHVFFWQGARGGRGARGPTGKSGEKVSWLSSQPIVTLCRSLLMGEYTSTISCASPVSICHCLHVTLHSYISIGRLRTGWAFRISWRNGKKNTVNILYVISWLIACYNGWLCFFKGPQGPQGRNGESGPKGSSVSCEITHRHTHTNLKWIH